MYALNPEPLLRSPTSNAGGLGLSSLASDFYVVVEEQVRMTCVKTEFWVLPEMAVGVPLSVSMTSKRYYNAMYKGCCQGDCYNYYEDSYEGY